MLYIDKTKTEKEIIWDALNNFEAQYSDCEMTVEILSPEISRDKIEKEYMAFMQYCINNDLI